MDPDAAGPAAGTGTHARSTGRASSRKGGPARLSDRPGAREASSSSEIAQDRASGTSPQVAGRVPVDTLTLARSSHSGAKTKRLSRDRDGRLKKAAFAKELLYTFTEVPVRGIEALAATPERTSRDR